MKNDNPHPPVLHGEGKDVYVIICGEKFFLHDFPKMLEIYFRELVTDKSAHYALEELGRMRCQNENGFSPENPKDVREFVTQVCAWGGDPDIGENVLQTPGTIARALNKAADYIRQGNVAEAIVSVQVPGLGPSYGSKHLRMLCPEKCVVYNSVLTGAFSQCYGDGLDDKKYAKFCAILAELARKFPDDIPNQERECGKWFAADIEAAIFCKYYSKTRDIVEDAIKRR